MKRKRLHLAAIGLILCLLVSGIGEMPLSALTYTQGANPPSTAYQQSVYYDRLSALPHTGDGRTDLIAVALSQLGYTEGNDNGDYGGVSNGNQNFTEYNYNMGSFGVGYGGSNYPWCASFVSFCLLQAGTHNQTKIADWCRKHEGDAAYIWREVSCSKWASQLRQCGYFSDSAHFGGSYTPLSGDLIFFTQNGSTESHIGIVLYTEGDRVYTVEGNTSPAAGLESNGGGVYLKSYPRTSSYIRGYGVLPYPANQEITTIDYTGKSPSAGIYVSTTAKYLFLTEDAEAHTYLLPRYSFFTVTEIAANGRLKAICHINGEEITGYLLNNEDRVIQLSAEKAAALPEEGADDIQPPVQEEIPDDALPPVIEEELLPPTQEEDTNTSAPILPEKNEKSTTAGAATTAPGRVTTRTESASCTSTLDVSPLALLICLPLLFKKKE